MITFVNSLPAYQLNCVSVGWLTPNQSVTFALALGIPADTPHPGHGAVMPFRFPDTEAVISDPAAAD